MKPATLKGRLSIGRISRFYGEGYIEIEIEDELSGKIILKANIAYADFAQGLTGLNAMPCDLKYYESDVIGKKRQSQEILIPCPKCPPYDEKTFISYMKKLVKPHETDGWKADLRGGRNMHRWNGKTYSVLFRRYVEEKSGREVQND